MLFLIFLPPFPGLVAFWIVYGLFIDQVIDINKVGKLAISMGLTIYVPIVVGWVGMNLLAMINDDSLKCTGLSLILLVSIFSSFIQTLVGFVWSISSFFKCNFKIGMMAIILKIIPLPLTFMILSSGLLASGLPDCR